MKKTCGEKCYRTMCLDRFTGKRLMMAVEGNRKFHAGTLHQQCPECLEEEIRQMKEAVVFGTDSGLMEKEARLKERLTALGIRKE